MGRAIRSQARLRRRPPRCIAFMTERNGMAGQSNGRRVNLAMVGCGGIAGAHLRGYAELLEKNETRFRIVAAVDDIPERAREMADRIESHTGEPVNAYRTVEELLNGEKHLDGADICGPHGPASRPGMRASCRRRAYSLRKTHRHHGESHEKDNRRGKETQTHCRNGRTVPPQRRTARHPLGLQRGRAAGGTPLLAGCQRLLAGPAEVPGLALARGPSAGRVRHGDGQRRPLGGYDALLVRRNRQRLRPRGAN